MKPLKINLSKFKKVAQDEHFTTLENDQSHQFKIAHRGVKPEMIEQLKALPLHGGADPMKLSQGGAIPPVAMSTQSGMNAIKKENYKGSPKPKKGKENKRKDGILAFADGGEAPEAQTAQDTPEQIMQDAAGAAPAIPNAAPARTGINQDLIDKRNIYNQLAADSDEGDYAMFGPNGEEPQNFNPALAQQADKQHEAAKIDQQKEAQKSAQDMAQTNAMRQKYGLAPIASEPRSADVASTQNVAGARTDNTEAPTPPTTINDDPFGAKLGMTATVGGLQQTGLGIEEQAQGMKAQSANEASALHSSLSQMNAAQSIYKAKQNDLESHHAQFMKDVQEQHIDPNHYLGSMDTGQRIATGIGLLLGGIGSGLTHQPNAALEFLQTQIDRDIKAQQANLGKKETLLSANMKMMGNLKDAQDMTRVQMNDILGAKLKEAGARAGGTMAQGWLDQQMGKLQMDNAQKLQSVAARQTILDGTRTGKLSPETVVNWSGLGTPQQQEQANKELHDIQDQVAIRDRMLTTFDKLSKTNTLGNYLTSPLQTQSQKNSFLAAIVPGLSKEQAGRYTEADAAQIQKMLKSVIDSPATIGQKRQEFASMLNEKMHAPVLKGIYQIDPANMGIYSGPGGSSRIPFKPSR